jgi:hypothetical protein
VINRTNKENTRIMRKLSRGHRLAVAGSAGLMAMIASLGAGVGVAAAAPADPASGVAPQFYNGKVNAIRNSGSDTTFFVMQKIDDLYTSAGLYGCTLNVGGETSLYNNSFLPSTSSNASDYCVSGGNIDTTDTADNWDRTEVTTGVDSVGSGAGQNQLCGAANSPFTVDFARSSKPPGTACGTLVGTGYAKDAVPAVDFPVVNPSTFGTVASTSPYFSINGGSIGPVAQGWLPGNPVNGPYTGTAFTDVSNADNGGGANATSYRLWCATGTSRVTDWGQLTNLSASGPGNGGVAKTVGNGAPVGVPIRIMGVNPSSGTEATFTGFINGAGTPACSTTNGNAANDPNPATAPTPNSPHVALENNTSQVGDFAASDFPGDLASQAVEVATTLYYASNGVLNTVPFSGSATIGTSSFTASKITENEISPSTRFILGNNYPTARTLWNIYRSDNIKASTGGFLNWICDSNTSFQKAKDNSTGLNFDAEVTADIGAFGFIRLSDTSASAAVSTPADGIAAPNTTCASGVTAGVGNGIPAVTSVVNANG